MKNKTFWFFATLFVLAWALFEAHPLRGRNLIDVFEQEALNTDTNLAPAAAQERLKQIVEEARRLERERPERTFANLREAIGTNVITNFFAHLNVKTHRDPTQAILHQLQREAAGRIKLGLDLQGGTSFLVAMQFGSMLLTPEEITDPASLAGKLQKGADPLSQYLWGQLSSEAQRVVTNATSRTDDRRRALAEALNKVLTGVPFYEPARFAHVKLSAAAQALLAQQPQGDERVRLHRLLLEEAFPNEIAKGGLRSEDERSGALEQAVEVLRKRVDRFGVAEPIIQPAGRDRILIQLPGLSEAEKESARTTIQKAAFLEFRLVHPDSHNLVQQGVVEPGYEILQLKDRARDGREILVPYLVKKKAERGLTGKHVVRAYPDRNPMTGELEINFTLNDEGARLFADITREHQGEQLAIVLDGELYSAPVIREPITGGRGSISGRFNVKEAMELANVLENPLEAPLRIEEERSVDPSLGRDSITSGVTASLIAAAGTFVFMLVFYFASGLVANLALALNVLILLGAMCAIDSTLTMPGIAGIALTIGMAVDANVLIYERMREEIAAGKSIRGVIAAGYQKAFGAIFDSNLTTVMAAIILMNLGSGPVKGFGVTLTIGICASMFTALVVTRLIYEFLLAKGWLRSIRMLPLIRFKALPFMDWAKIACTVSAVLILAGLAYGIVRGKRVMGVDFIGGEAVTITFAQRVEVDQLRAALDRAGLGDSSIQYQRNLSTGLETLQVVTPAASGATAHQALSQAFPQAGFSVIGTDVVGATIGAQIQKSAGIATLLALFVILIYVAFRYEFSFAIAAVVALLHDVLITLGIYFLSGRQLTAPMVAAILTIIGYSINDKIVIMDRIREDLKLGIRGSFKELINLALNQTLSRTMITGGAVILATLALLFFGGGVINDFAFTFLVGVLSGTYSSLLIASPIVLWYHKGERPVAFGGVLAVQSGPSLQQSAAGAR